MISVAIVGSGNVAYHITNALMESNAVKVKQLYTRNSQDFGYWKSNFRNPLTFFPSEPFHIHHC